MLSEYDFRKLVEKYSAMPVERFRIVQEVDDLLISGVRRGVIFILAVWSGPAVEAFCRFTRVINLMDTQSIDVVILDTDCLTDELATRLFGNEHFTTGGWGEVIWLRDGRPVAREIAREGSEVLLKQHTKGLLDENTA